MAFIRRLAAVRPPPLKSGAIDDSLGVVRSQMSFELSTPIIPMSSGTCIPKHLVVERMISQVSSFAAKIPQGLYSQAIKRRSLF